MAVFAGDDNLFHRRLFDLFEELFIEQEICQILDENRWMFSRPPVYHKDSAQ